MRIVTAVLSAYFPFDMFTVFPSDTRPYMALTIYKPSTVYYFKLVSLFSVRGGEMGLFLSYDDTTYVYHELRYTSWVRVPPEAVFSLKNNCLNWLCCFVFLCCIALPFFLSISWMIKSYTSIYITSICTYQLHTVLLHIYI